MRSNATEGTSAGSKELWKMVRDQLIEKIRSGAYPAGALLPSINQLTVDLSVSTTTARKAMAELAAAGYAESKGTRGFISLGPTPIAKPQPTADEPVRGVLTVRASRSMRVHEEVAAEIVAVDVREEPPSAEAALALRAHDPSSSLVVRRALSQDGRGTPMEFRTDYFTSEVVLSVPESAADLPGGLEDIGTRLGRQVSWARRHLTARHPTDGEAAALGLLPASVVLVRVGLAIDETGTPLAYSESVWPAEGLQLDLG